MVINEKIHFCVHREYGDVPVASFRLDTRTVSGNNPNDWVHPHPLRLGGKCRPPLSNPAEKKIEISHHAVFP